MIVFSKPEQKMDGQIRTHDQHCVHPVVIKRAWLENP